MWLKTADSTRTPSSVGYTPGSVRTQALFGVTDLLDLVEEEADELVNQTAGLLNAGDSSDMLPRRRDTLTTADPGRNGSIDEDVAAQEHVDYCLVSGTRSSLTAGKTQVCEAMAYPVVVEHLPRKSASGRRGGL